MDKTSPLQLPAGDTAWIETSVMRRDYIDYFGDYIPRGQKHFKVCAIRSGKCRLSVRSMQTLKAAAVQGDLTALEVLLHGTLPRGLRLPAMILQQAGPVATTPTEPSMPTPLPRFYRSGNLPPRPEDIAKIKRALLRGALSKQALIERTALSQTRVLCAIDALIAAGDVAYAVDSKLFSIRTGDDL